MYLRDVTGSLWRRWYLTLAGLILSGGLVILALQVVHPAWESDGNLVLLPPRSTIQPGGNPYLQLGGLAPTLDLLVVTMSDEQMVRQIQSISPTAKYTVKADTTSAGPVLLVTATDRTVQSAIRVRDELIREAPVRLTALQDALSITPNARIRSMTITQDPKAEIVSRNQIRAVVVAGGVGVVGTALLVAYIDGVAMRRRRRVLAGVAAGLESPWLQPVATPPDPTAAPAVARPRAVPRSTTGALQVAPRAAPREGRDAAAPDWNWGETQQP